MQQIARMQLYAYLSILLALFLATNIAHATMIVGHRGARDLLPESTLIGYQTAIRLGVDYIDMDIVMTKDRELIVFHDIELNPSITRDQHGHWIKMEIPVKQLTLQQLRTFNVGSIKPDSSYHQRFPKQIPLPYAGIPTLREAIIMAKRINKNIRFQIEIKTDPTRPMNSAAPEIIAKQLINLLNELQVNNKVRIQAFDWRCLYAIQRLNPALPTAYLTSPEQEALMHDKDAERAGLWTGGKLLKNYQNSIPLMIKTLGGSAWDPEASTITAEKLARAHQLGLEVFTWSNSERKNDDTDEIKQLLQLRVDGIISDRPDLALQTLHSINRQKVL